MPKLDPDTAPLHKDIKVLHARLKKALTKKSVEHIQDCLAASFGSQVHMSRAYNKYQNECQQLNWRCEVIEPYRNILLSTSVQLSFDEEDALADMVINDKWIYAAQFPQPLTLSIHEAWAKKLVHVTQLLAQPEGSTPAIFDWWNEDQTIEHLGWLLSDEEKESSTLDPHAIGDHYAERARLVITALENEPEQAALHWPTLAPWLQAMRGLMPPPPFCSDNDLVDTAGWTLWSQTLRTLRLQQPSEALALPPAFDDPAPLPHG